MEIFSVFWFVERMDYSAIVRAKNRTEAKAKIKKLLGVTPRKAFTMTFLDIEDFGITKRDIKEMDKKGYFIYDCGT